MGRIKPFEPYDFELCCPWYPVKPFTAKLILTKAESNSPSQYLFSLTLDMVFCGKPSPGKWLPDLYLSINGALTRTVQLASHVEQEG